MISRSIIDRLIPVLRKSAKRSLRMHVAGFRNPYYCALLLRDTNWFNTWASAGSTYRRRSDHTRNVYCDMRVGSYRYDQTTDGGLFDNDEELESYTHITVPIDDRDKDYGGLRIALWRLTESKAREAMSDYNQKEAVRLSTVDQNRKFYSFTKMPARRFISYSNPERVDEQKWQLFCKSISKWMSKLSKVSGSWIEFDASQESKIFVNTEGSVVVQHRQIFSLSATLRHLGRDGSQIEQELVINCGSQKELPGVRELKRMLTEKYQQLLELMQSKKIHSFSGPVLLYPLPAGLLFHEAIGHRLEGSRLLSSGEGRTFKGQIGKKVMNVPLTIRDNPLLKRFQGRRCIGSFQYDDEGVPAEDTLLVEGGVLRDFLSSRAGLKMRNHQSNGHARNAKFERPISRMGVTIVEGDEPVSMEELREKLVEEINRQNKPFGMIVYETSGGETETGTYDFQAFSGEVSFASLVYPDGHEVIVRGVDFVGTPLQALSNIVAVGDEQDLDNSYCGAESGFVPVTTIAPAILLRNLELQAKEEELVTQYILSRPRLS